MKKESPILNRVTRKRARLVPACFTTGRSLGYSPCLLGLSELGYSGMSVWSNKIWEEGSLLDLEMYDRYGLKFYLTCAVRRVKDKRGQLSLYELNFYELSKENGNRLQRLFYPYHSKSEIPPVAEAGLLSQVG